MAKWLVKSDPETYGLSDFIAEKKTDWTGVRNFQARNFLSQMSIGDSCVFYHSNKDRACVALASVTKAAFPDTTAKEGEWVAVEIAYESTFEKPVTLTQIKANPILSNIPLIKQSRLSVMPLQEEEYGEIVKMSRLD